VKPRSPRTSIADARGAPPAEVAPAPSTATANGVPCTDEQIKRLADDAWLIQLLPEAPRPDARTNQRVHRHAARIRQRGPAWLKDLVPAYASLAVFFDGKHISAAQVKDWLREVCAEDKVGEAQPSLTDRRGTDECLPAPVTSSASVVEIPVLYGGVHGEDLESSAAELGLSSEALIARHCAADYTVAMIGFAPGFPYLLGLDPSLALPRLGTPRARVPAGSVAIGGSQTGIYPGESPGGWRLLGRTPLRLFDPLRDPPCLLVPGERVRFRAIDAQTFEHLARTA
jgi:KipI family sensor histidine kinase inhibitor